MAATNISSIADAEILIGSQTTIEADLQALQNHITEYRTALNDEGVWLFLVTLGCWGVTNQLFQLVAYILTAVLFGDRMTKKIKDKRSFSELVRALQNKIKNLTNEGEARKARLYDLAELQKRELSTLTSLRNVKVFFFCWLFYIFSLFYSFPPQAFKTIRHLFGF